MSTIEKRRATLINLVYYSLLIAAYYLFLKYAFWIVAPFIFAFAVAMFLQKPIRKINKKTNILEVFLIVIEISIFIFQCLEYDNWIFPSYFFQKKKIIIFLFVI